MYISEIIQYLIWPLLIIVSWFAVKTGLKLYERKFPSKEDVSGRTLQGKSKES